MSFKCSQQNEVESAIADNVRGEQKRIELKVIYVYSNILTLICADSKNWLVVRCGKFIVRLQTIYSIEHCNRHIWRIKLFDKSYTRMKKKSEPRSNESSKSKSIWKSEGKSKGMLFPLKP